MPEPSTHSDVTAAPAAARQVAELGQLVRRAADTWRTHKSQHQLTRQALDRVCERLIAALAAGPLQLEVTLAGLMHDDRLIGVSQSGGPARREDPLTAPLFGEGVRRLTFLPGLEPAELTAFLESWLSSVVAGPSSEGVTTRFWEAELKHVQLVVIDSFTAGADAPLDPDARRGKLTARQQIDSLVTAISSEGMAGGADLAASATVMRIGAADIALLRDASLRGITADALAAQDVANSQAVASLSRAELQPLADELSRLRHDAVFDFTRQLLNAAVRAGEPDREALLARAEAVVRALITEGQFMAPLEVYQRLVGSAKADGELTEARTALLVRLKGALTSDWVLQHLLAAVDADEPSAAAFEVLQVTGKAFQARLAAALSKVKSPAARARLAGLVTDAMPVAEVLPKVKAMDSAAFAELLRKLGSFTPADQAALLTEGLHSHDHAVHRVAIAALTPAVVPLLKRGLFAAQLASPDAEVRAVALELAVELEDPSCAQPLAQLLGSPRVGLDERRHIYRALESLGDPKVVPQLLAELERQSDVDAKVAVVRTLGVLRDPLARAPLEALSHRLLAPQKLKAAAKAALELLGAAP